MTAARDAPHGTPPAVELRDVAKSRGGRRVVDGVSLRIARGEFFALLGPSGCGKTTTLRMIAGFEEPDEGRVLLGGTDVAGVPPYRRDTNTVFQDYALFPHLSVGRNVSFGLDVLGIAAAEVEVRVREALDLVQMEGLGARMPSQLSGGQQQRVAVARALVRRPSVLLLDEPLGALDLQLRKGMQVELKRLQRRLGTTFVHVTHDQEEALAMADRVAVMDRGRIVQVGTPEEVYERPATAFVARFLGDANVLAGTVASVDAAGTAIVVAGGGAIRAAETAGLRVGAAVEVVLRPERIAFGTEGIPSVVEEVTFVGADVRFLARLADGAVVAVRRPAEETRRPRVGDAVHLSAPPAAFRVVRPTETGERISQVSAGERLPPPRRPTEGRKGVRPRGSSPG